jgi:hypothetical protein
VPNVTGVSGATGEFFVSTVGTVFTFDQVPESAGFFHEEPGGIIELYAVFATMFGIIKRMIRRSHEAAGIYVN